MERMPLAEKEQFCEYLYNEYILDAADILKEYNSLEMVNLVLPVSCYTNFRDAIFHFRKLVSCDERQLIEEQAFAIKEHLSRAITDASNVILYRIAQIYELFIADEKFSIGEKSEFRKRMHEIKKFILIKRINGMMLSANNFSFYDHGEIKSVINQQMVFISEYYAEDYARKNQELG